MAARRDQDASNSGTVKRHSSLRRFDIFRPHAQSIASLSRTSSSSSTTRPSVFRKPTLRKMPKTNSLSIHLPPTERSGSGCGSGPHSGLTSPTPRTPLSPHSPQSPVRNNEMHGIQQAQYAEGYDVHVRSPINALPPPPSPKSPKHKTSKIFANYKASKSTTKVNKAESPRLGTSSNSDTASSQLYLNRSAGKSSPDIGSLVHSDHPSPQSEYPSELGEDRKDSVTAKEKDKRKEKHKFGNLLGRKASLKTEDDLPTPRTDKPLTPGRDKGRIEPASRTVKDRQPTEGPIRTAPLEKERGFRSAMNSALRNRSLDRQTNPEEEEENAPPPPPPRQSHTSKAPSTSKSNGPPNTSFIHSIKFSGSKAAEGVNKARKGFFGKLGRSASSHEREPVVKEPYELKVITLPLVEQTRKTRISKRLEKSKDKTEFWMPALPWRCIDYLNLNGTTSEGLYRVPGSDKDIRHWQMRFDKELDINLFDQEDLYDVNTVSSMFKAWLRGLPELVFPQEIQNKIIEKCAKVDPQPTSTPQFLKDELSKLPPWNYYLLFAITCHISLLHNCSKDNKMTYANLNICFAPCLKVEGWIFQWLILDWKNCWQGCSSEREYLDKEYALLDEQERQEDGGETASIVTTRSKSSTAASFTMRSAPSSAPRSNSARGPEGGGSLVPSRDRPVQHFDKHSPLTSSNRDQSHRPSTSHASLAAEQRTISSKESSRPSLLDDASSNGGRSTPDHESMRYFAQPVQPANVNGNNLQASEKMNRKDERSPNRPSANHIASQQRTKESSRERNHDRTVSSTTKKGKHRPPPMRSTDSPEDRSSSGERNGNGHKKERVKITAPELSPMKPLSPLMYD